MEIIRLRGIDCFSKLKANMPLDVSSASGFKDGAVAISIRRVILAAEGSSTESNYRIIILKSLSYCLNNFDQFKAF